MTSIFTTDPEEREQKWRDLVVLMKEDGLVHDEELQTLEQEVHRAAELHEGAVDHPGSGDVGDLGANFLQIFGGLVLGCIETKSIK